jgi:hypothetical protein
MIRLAAVAATVVVAGCALPPLDPAAVSRASNLELCQTVAQGRQLNSADWIATARAELVRRGAMTDEELVDVNRQRVRIGQREHIAVCAWGPYIDVNETVGRGFRQRQFVMGQFGPYVYTDGRRVTGFQQ